MANPKFYPMLVVLLTLVTALQPSFSHGDDGTPSLNQFVSTLVASHPDVIASFQALKATEAEALAAGRPLYNPELSFEAENAEEQTRTVGLSQTLDWTRKSKSQRSMADAEQAIAEARYKLTRWEVMTDLLGLLAAFDLGTERERLANDRASLMDDFSVIAKKRFSVGDLTSVEMNLAYLAVTEAKMQRANAVVSLSDARQQVLSFFPPSTVGWPKLAQSFPTPPSGSDAYDVSELPENLVARLAVRRAEEEVQLREKERKPDPTLGLVGGKEGDEDLVALSFSLPIHVRNNFRAEVSAALARSEESKQRRDGIHRQTTARVRSAITRYQISYEAWTEWEDVGLKSLGEQRSELNKLWESGELSATEYLVQLRQTLDVQETAIELRLDLWDSWFEWLRASGRVESWLQGES